MRIALTSLAVVSLVALAGCATAPKSGYMSSEDDVFGKASAMEYTQKRRSVAQAVERLLTDPMFTEKYAAAKKRAGAAGRTCPTLSIRAIENNTGDGRSDAAATGQAHRELLTALRKTGRFELIDRVARKRMTTGAVAAVNEGEGADAIAGIGNFASVDFEMSGSLNRDQTESDDRTVYHHTLNLEMVDTASGTVFWSDTVAVTKFDGKD